MRRLFTILLLQALLVSAGSLAAENPPQITEREIIERLTRLEEGQNTLRAEIQANARAIEQLRQDMHAQFSRIDVQFSRIDAQFDRIDAQFGRIDAQFGRMTTLLLGIVGAFAAITGTSCSRAVSNIHILDHNPVEGHPPWTAPQSVARPGLRAVSLLQPHRPQGMARHGGCGGRRAQMSAVPSV